MFDLFGEAVTTPQGSIKKLKEWVRYEPESGAFYWIKKSGSRGVCGAVAGYLRKDGYRVIKIDGVVYYAHRLAWLFTYEVNPDLIDHINQIRDDNRIQNLRNADKAINAWNTKLFKTNTSGHKCISWNKPMKKWRLSAVRRGVLHRSYFASKEEAIEAYKILELANA